jgi:hypothetical protein
MNKKTLIYECMFCENKVYKCYKCIYCANILCYDCYFGDDITPMGVSEYCCDNKDDCNKYKIYK